MKTTLYFLCWVLTRIAWALIRWIDHRNPAEPLLSDAEVALQVSFEDSLANAAKTVFKLVVEA